MLLAFTWPCQIFNMLLEMVDRNLDAAQGVDRQAAQRYLKAPLQAKSLRQSVLAVDMEKPQLVHGWKIDNSRSSRFRPRILSTFVFPFGFRLFW